MPDNLSEENIMNFGEKNLSTVVREIADKLNEFSKLHGYERDRDIAFYPDFGKNRLPCVDLDYIWPKNAAEELAGLITSSDLTLERNSSSQNAHMGDVYFTIAADGKTIDALEKFKEGLTDFSGKLSRKIQDMQRKSSADKGNRL
jgi:hypothetical protein